MKNLDPAYFRRNADRCRLLISIAIHPTVREQLRLWARELMLSPMRWRRETLSMNTRR
jgi:hypothetical protein